MSSKAPPKKDIDDIHRKMVSLVNGTNRKVLGENTDKEKQLWRLDVQHGNYRVNIFHPLQHRWVEVVFLLRFELNDAQKKVLESIYSNPNERFTFDHGLRSCLASPCTFYNIKYDKVEDKTEIPNVIITGAKLFPLDSSFSIHILENAIQSVVSAGSLGHNFLASVLRVGETSIKQQEAFTSTPEGMYS